MTAHDKDMFDKGYRYSLTPTDRSFVPLYSKSSNQIGQFIREYYPDKTFWIEKLDSAATTGAI